MPNAAMAEDGFYRRKSLPRRTDRIVTLLDATDVVESSISPSNLVILPPDSGDKHVDSDVEEIPDMLDEDCLVEPAGEFELEEDNETEDESCSDDEDTEEPPAKQKKSSATSLRWKKSTTFTLSLMTLTRLNSLMNQTSSLLLLFSYGAACTH